MKLLITGACGHIGSFLAENIHKIKIVKQDKTIIEKSLISLISPNINAIITLIS